LALDENIGPNASHQILLADHLSVALKQSNQDFQSATSERHGLVAFQQKELRSKKAKRPLAEIAFAVGFFDQGHLARHFRHLLGKTPREFRWSQR